MKRANSMTVRTALHEMRMFTEMMSALGESGLPALYFSRIIRIQAAVDDDDLGDLRGMPATEAADVLPSPP